MTERDAFEEFWRFSRAGNGRDRADLELARHADRPAEYASESTQRHWWTWQQSAKWTRMECFPFQGAVVSEVRNDTKWPVTINEVAIKPGQALAVWPERCNPHPQAPHGFNRNASHNAGRYVCDCEGWTP